MFHYRTDVYDAISARVCTYSGSNRLEQMWATKQSEVWQYFTQLDDKVDCTLCGMTLAYHGSTRAMRTCLLKKKMLRFRSKKDQTERQ